MTAPEAVHQTQVATIPRIIFIDIEASDLDGYPIEIGWCDAAGDVESHLIRPLSHWTGWSKKAESMHGIKRQTLLDQGEIAQVVARRAMAVLSGAQLFSDNPAYDQEWLTQLIETIGLQAMPQIVHVSHLFIHTCNGVPDAYARTTIDTALMQSRHLHSHRAAADAHRLWTTWQAIRVAAEQF